MTLKSSRCLTALLGLAMAVLVVLPTTAQEQFFTQSGGHGIENAKANARLTKNEKDIDTLNVQVAKVKQHAYVDIPSCGDPGSKLRWNNGAWTCDNETDPTVQGWAKKALPTCGPGQILSASGDGFGCTSANYLSNETDPTVQAWAKSALPSCGSGEVLTATGGAFTCKVDDKGIIQETDPFVYPFARTDQATITDCNAGQKLTMTGARLVCSPDAVGVTSETDPFVQKFARNDISGSIVGACGAGKVLTAVSSGGNVFLSCISDAGAGSASLNLSQLGDVDVSAKASGTALVYNTTSSKWIAASPVDTTVQAFARASIGGACTVSQVLVYNGSALACVAASSVISTSSKLSDLTDTDISGTANHQILTYNGSKWVNLSKIDGVTIGSSVPASATFTTVVATTIGAGNIAASGYVTAPVIYSSGSLVQGNEVVSGDLHVGGTLYVSGGQSIDGVLFANGGVSATGTISASRFVGDGSGLTGAFGGSVSWSNVTGVPTVLQNISNSTGSVTATSIYVSEGVVDNDLHVKGNLYVSGSQSFDGVTFANGGVSATGSVTATSFSGDGSGLANVLANAVSWTHILGVPAGVANISNSTGSVTVTSINAASALVSNETVQDDLHVQGNLYVSGSQSIDGVMFANGGVSATGTVSATHFSGDGSGLAGVLASAVSWTHILGVPAGVANISNSTGSITVTSINAASALVSNATVQDDLHVGGNLYVSGSQSIDGVMFANGGVSATGTVSATRFSGDGSGLSGIAPTSISWSIINGVPTVLQNISNSTGSVTVTTVTANLISTTGGGTVSGTYGYFNSISGTTVSGKFVGDGSGLTGVVAAGSDRITSGTTQMVVISSTGYISLTQAGTNTGWFDPSRGLVTIGVSSTGAVSGTRGYFTTELGVGANPDTTASMLAVSGTLGANALISLNNGSSTGYTYEDFNGTGSKFGVGVGNAGETQFGVANKFFVYDHASGVKMVIDSNGYMGVNTTSPSTNLEVNGGISGTVISTTALFVTGAPTAASIVNNSTVASALLIANTANSGYSGIEISGTGHLWASGAGNAGETTFGVPNKFYIFDGTLGQPRLVIDTVGNMGLGTTNPTAKLEVVGDISASNVYVTATTGTVSGTYGYFHYLSGTQISGKFVGDGSGLTGVTAGSSDRIVSGTTSMIAVSTTGFISLTQAGTNTGWFDPTRGLVTIGISATGTISGTNGYFSGKVGLGTPSPQDTLHLYATADDQGLTLDRSTNTTIGTGLHFATTGTTKWSFGTDNDSTDNLYMWTPANSYAEPIQMWNYSTGYVGINNHFPNAQLDVNGTISASNVYVTATTGTVSATYGYFNYISGTQISGKFVGDGSGLTGVTAGSSDRIVSGTTSMIAVSTTGFISLTQAGTNTGWFDPTRGLVTIGVSSTGAISGTKGYFSSNVGIGTAPSPSLGLQVINSSTYATLEVDNLEPGNNFVNTINAFAPNLTAGQGTCMNQGVKGAPNDTAGPCFRYMGDGSVSNSYDIFFGWQPTPVATFMANGMVGIGTDTPSNTLHIVNNDAAQLAVDNSTDGQASIMFRVQGNEQWDIGTDSMGNGTKDFFIYDSAANASRVYITPGGNVGINNTSPNATLDVLGTISASNVYVTGTTGTVSATYGYFKYISSTHADFSNLTVNGAPISGVSPSWYTLTNIPTVIQNVSNSTGSVTVTTVTANLISTTGGGTVSATNGYFLNVSATHFVGDGSGLTGVTAGSADRIVSGTTSMIAISNTGFISLTQAGTNTGWFDPSRGLVTIGVSSTGGVSGTTGYFSDNVGIGSTATNLAHWGNTFRVMTILGNGNSTAGSSGIIELAGNQADGAGNYSGALDFLATGNTTNKEIAMILANTSGVTAGSRGGVMGFYTKADGGTTMNEEMRIDSLGNVGINTTSPTAKLEVNGTISASNVYVTGTTGTVSATYGYFKNISGTTISGKFIGDGSGLTGVTAGSSDRIVSGTTSMIAVSTTGFISLTQAGTNTGWFDPTRGLVTIGVSSTGPISGTSGYFSSYVGVGTTAPSATLHVHNGSVLFTNGDKTTTQSFFTLGSTDASNPMQLVFSRSTNQSWNLQSAEQGIAYRNLVLQLNGGSVGIGSSTPAAKLEVMDSGLGPVENIANLTNAGYAYEVVSGTNHAYSMGVGNAGETTFGVANKFFIGDQSDVAMRLVIDTAGNVGISTTNPTAKLEVNGTISASNVYVTGTTGTVSATNGYFLNVSATHFVGDGSGLTGVTAGSADRIVSGTTSMIAISNTGYISLTQAGTNTGWFDPTRGLVTIGVSSTGSISGTGGYFSGNVGIGMANTGLAQLQTSGGSTNSAAIIGAQSLWGVPGSSDSGIGFNSYLDGSLGQRAITNGVGAMIWLSTNAAGGTPDSLTFWTAPSVSAGAGQAMTEQMRITNAGHVGIGITSPTATLEVGGTISASNVYVTATTGTVSATYGYFNYISGTQISGKFVGDGSGLTGVTAGSSDRIVSGTTSMIAVSTTGFISLTQAGTNTGWFDPTRGLVTIGVSSTGPISGTSGYFNGNVGIGGVSSGVPLFVSTNRDVNTGGPGFEYDNSGVIRTQLYPWGGQFWYLNSGSGEVGQIQYSTPGNLPGIVFWNGSTAGRSQIAMLTSTGGLSFGATTGSSNPGTQLALTTDGNVGIGTASPNATLDVIGTISASNVYVTATTGTVSGTYGYFHYISGTQISGKFVGDGSGLTGVTAGSSDRIVSGTTSMIAVSTTGFISLTQAGTNTGWLDPARGLVTIGISTTGIISTTGLYANGNATVSGTVRMSGTGAETCGASTYGTMRFVSSSNAYGIQVCRP